VRLFITGGNGFLGSAVVRRALDRGHDARALVRSAEAGRRLAATCEGVEIVVGNLRRPDEWLGELEGVDAVIHLAAAKPGGFYQMFPDTVIATERLLAAMGTMDVDRIVHVSSLAVYDFDARAPGSRFDESVPDERDRLTRDAYGQTKLYQEELVRTAGLRHTVIRPGAVWGAGHLWDGGLGQIAGPLWVAVGDAVPERFTYVENCADAIVIAAEEPRAVGAKLNVIDDDLPSQRAYARALRGRGVDLPFALPVPFGVLRVLAWLIAVFDRRFVGGRLKVPSMLTLRALDTRFKPFVFDNSRAKDVLGWSPRYDFDQALSRACNQE
jgi:nucleoside-diphosphate-sugar epimerase